MLYDLIYTAFRQKQNYRDEKQISCQPRFGGWGKQVKKTVMFMAVTLFSMTLQWWIHDKVHFLKGTELQNTKSEL